MKNTDKALANAINPILATSIPLMTQDSFAELTGLKDVGETVVAGMVQRKTLPTFKLGRYRMIDMDGLREMIAAAREQQ